MKIVAIADLHNQTPVLPDGDLLLICGDLTHSGTIPQLTKVCDWVRGQPHKHKVIIAGNHDFCFENNKSLEAEIMVNAVATYLQDSFVVIDGKTIYGSPWQPWFHDWAFNLTRGPEIAAKWGLILPDVDVLAVHGPPFGYGDRAYGGQNVGCDDLLKEIAIKNPKNVFYGHIHEDVGHWKVGNSNLYNCSIGSSSNITVVDV